jgi:hypothetical protein
MIWHTDSDLVDTLRAEINRQDVEIKRLRAALREIAGIDFDYQTMNDIARNALKEGRTDDAEQTGDRNAGARHAVAWEQT